MRPRELFGVVLRVLGIWFLTRGAYYTFFTVLKSAGVPTSSEVPVTEDKLIAAFYFVIGLIILILGDHIVRLIYGPLSNTEKQ